VSDEGNVAEEFVRLCPPLAGDERHWVKRVFQLGPFNAHSTPEEVGLASAYSRSVRKRLAGGLGRGRVRSEKQALKRPQAFLSQKRRERRQWRSSVHAKPLCEGKSAHLSHRAHVRPSSRLGRRVPG
jgi:hypothetical protein